MSVNRRFSVLDLQRSWFLLLTKRSTAFEDKNRWLPRTRLLFFFFLVVEGNLYFIHILPILRPRDSVMKGLDINHQWRGRKHRRSPSKGRVKKKWQERREEQKKCFNFMFNKITKHFVKQGMQLFSDILKRQAIEFNNLTCKTAHVLIISKLLSITQKNWMHMLVSGRRNCCISFSQKLSFVLYLQQRPLECS